MLPCEVEYGGPAVLSRSPPRATDARRSGPKYLRPAGARRQRVPAHEPAVPGNRGVVQKVGADNPVELSVGMMGGDALVKAVTVIVSVLLRFGFAVELGGAARHFAAVSNGGPVAPVKALAHSEIRRESVIQAELDGASVQKPCLVAGRISRDVKAIPGRSGWTMRAATLEATVLMNRCAGIMLPGKPDRGLELRRPGRVVAGSKICAVVNRPPKGVGGRPGCVGQEAS